MTSSTERMALADRLELMADERPGKAADLNEAARLLREPVAGEAGPLNPGELFWGVMRASHIAQNAASVLRTQPTKMEPVLGALDQLAKDMDEILNPPATVFKGPA